MGAEINISIKKTAQVTIFIIVGILLVVSIIALFIFLGDFNFFKSQDFNPKQFIDSCVKEAVEPSIESVLLGGGRIKPELFIKYQDEDYNYLCYNKNYYSSCINHYPQLKEIIEEEIISDSQDRVKDCFNKLKKEAERKNSVLTEKELSYDIELNSGVVMIKLEKNIEVSSEAGSQSFSNFDSNLISPVYDLAYVAREIVSQESQYCNFEYNGFMLFYPQFNIKRIDYDESKIYILTEKISGKEFKFAIRSCALPPGI